MAYIVVLAEKLIARPIEMVRAQFTDMEHHAKQSVHAAFMLSDVRLMPNGYRFTLQRRVFGFWQEDECELVRDEDGDSYLRSLSGSHAGLELVHEFEEPVPGLTRVYATLSLPVRGVLLSLSPLLRLRMQACLEQVLEEDRRDIEDHNYPRP